MLTERIRNVLRGVLILTGAALAVGASSAVVPAAPSDGQWWRPAVGTDWQWQLSGTVDTSVAAEVFDIDGEGASAATVAALHANGARVICYIDAGGWESYRSDAGSFPAGVLGNAVDGWPEERWLDIRELTVLLPIMEARIADCDQKGFDAVEPDLLDGYTNDTGFALSAADQLAYNRALADLAHRYGLGVALKNDPEQAQALEPAFDFAVVEECFAYDECEAYSPFVQAGKAVLHVEYEGSIDTFCPATTALGFSSMKKHLALGAWRQVCPPDGASAIEAYVIRVYADLLGRAPEPAGLAGWTNALVSGTPYAEVANGITYSDEYRGRLIAASYATYLGRAPDPSGAAGWLAAMRAGVTIQQMEAGFVGSQEYYANAGGTDAAWVAQLYQHVLGRAAANTEIQAWVAALARGSSRYQVAMGFLVSYEHLTDVVDAYYWDLLGRGIDPTGNHGWVIAIQNGVRVEAVIAGIIASPEYRTNV